MKIIFISVFFCVAINGLAQNLDLSVTGNANFDNSLYSVSEAGEDFPSALVSESSAYISLEYTNFLAILFGSAIQWRIYINKSDAAWNENLTLETKRDGNGSRASVWGQAPIIQNGTYFQTITDTPAYFFRGTYGARDIPISFKLSGASLTMGANSFETTIVFTVYDD